MHGDPLSSHARAGEQGRDDWDDAGASIVTSPPCRAATLPWQRALRAVRDLDANGAQGVERIGAMGRRRAWDRRRK